MGRIIFYLTVHFEKSAKELQGVENSVNMTALVAVAGVDTGTDQPVADIGARAKGRLDIRAVVRVNVCGVVGAGSFCSVDQPSDKVIAVRAARNNPYRPR